ncbi:MAG: 50S ribosomal protein L13 [Candidatus Jorgensenbacteria bacterium]
MKYTIDAKGKKLGRLASEIAVILQGKKSPAYEPRLEGNDEVVVKNIKSMVISGRKSEEKVYYRHTGPLGHLKKRTYEEVFEKKPNWVLQNAVRLMLPKNRLLKKRMKKLVIE